MNLKAVRKVLLIFGTRPEAIKMAPVIEALKNGHSELDFRVCVTAQHREMLDQVLNFYDIRPDYDLDVMKKGQNLVSLSSSILDGLTEVFMNYKPDVVLVQGDTTTSTIAALAAFYSGIEVHHVEAGLRTLNKYSPYPEEVNRQVTARIADVHYAPTLAAKNNLLDEGIPANQIWVTGNTVIDALFLGLKKLENYTSKKIDDLRAIVSEERKLILVTGHRRESFGGGFQRICTALKQLSQRKDIQIIYPVHLNPNVQQPVNEILSDVENIHLIEPLEYPDFIWLMNQAQIILTDSGGIQEEAPSLKKPVLVMRDTTEREEAIEAGTAILVGTDPLKIISETERLLNSEADYLEMTSKENPFGDGKASQRIIDQLLN
jgi:UDP-N-acetylglucosamine 2-epimerase (non-hydrolysing)